MECRCYKSEISSVTPVCLFTVLMTKRREETSSTDSARACRDKNSKHVCISQAYVVGLFTISILQWQVQGSSQSKNESRKQEGIEYAKTECWPAREVWGTLPQEKDEIWRYESNSGVIWEAIKF